MSVVAVPRCRDHQHRAVADRRPERSLEPSAGQPRSLFAPDDHRRRDQQRRARIRWAAPSRTTTINGSQKAQVGTVNFQLDGGNNTAGLRGTGNPAPNPEAVQEFRVITNGSSAEYGRYPAGVVDVVTKSGTNQFRGALFEFFRDKRLNAKRWAAPGTPATGRIRSIATNMAARSAARSGWTRRSSSPATRACVRQRPTPRHRDRADRA